MNSQIQSVIEELEKNLDALDKRLVKIFKERGNTFYKRELTSKLDSLHENMLKLQKDITSPSNAHLEAFLSAIIYSLSNFPQYGSERKLFDKAIREIRLQLQELKIHLEDNREVLERIYSSKSPFDFYVDLQEIITETKTELFIVDSWIDEDMLEVHIKKIPATVKVRILTNSKNPKGNFLKVGAIFKKQHSDLEVREHFEVHDRAIFRDNSSWVIGQSIKDAARNKPTYLIKVQDWQKLRSIYDQIWNKSTKIL